MQATATGVEPRHVIRAISIAAAPATCWHFLTDAAAIGEWFAEVRRTGGVCEMQFGDGDFFEVHTVSATAPCLLEWQWRFWGVGGVSDIQFRIGEQPDGRTQVEVDDRGEYSESGAAELHEGWQDFLDRLRNRIETGRNSRYRWSETIGGAMITGAAPERVWSVVRDPAWWAAHFPGSGVELAGELQATFHNAAWSGLTTSATLSIRPRTNGIALAVDHGGWLQLPAAIQFDERKRVAEQWARALRQLERDL